MSSNPGALCAFALVGFAVGAGFTMGVCFVVSLLQFLVQPTEQFFCKKGK